MARRRHPQNVAHLIDLRVYQEVHRGFETLPYAFAIQSYSLPAELLHTASAECSLLVIRIGQGGAEGHDATAIDISCRTSRLALVQATLRAS